MVKITPATAKALTATQKLELSRVSPVALHREAMGTDVDIAKLTTYIFSRPRTNLADRIEDASINRTIDGASTLSITVTDYSRELLQSGQLSSALDIQLDGLWFRLAAVDKPVNGDELTLTFEDREIAILRKYSKWKIARRTKTTRAEFVLNMIREVREFKIPVVIPELHKVQPVERYSGDIEGVGVAYNKSHGINEDINTQKTSSMGQERAKGTTVGGSSGSTAVTVLRVKSAAATAEQIRNANIIMGVGEKMGVSRRLQVLAIMVAITESTLRNLKGGDNAHGGGEWDSAGLFQQTGDWGSYEDRTDAATTAKIFFEHAIKQDALEPDVPLHILAQDIQRSAFSDGSNYAPNRVDAERFVNAYGVTGGDAAAMNAQFSTGVSTTGQYVFFRGTIVDRGGNPTRKPENTWSCIQRLADEVDWRAFFVSGTFYFMSEDDLFKQKPIATLEEFEEGIHGIGGNYDGGKGSGTITVKAAAGRWQAPVGSVMVVKNMGPWNGRWLVSDYSRSLFDTEATITLKKPRPVLPEPVSNNNTGVDASWYDQGSDPTGITSSVQLRTQVLGNQRISFENASQREDIKTGQIDDQVLRFLLWITDRGYKISISALKSDHSSNTSAGNPSDHAGGRAVDIDTFNENNPDTDTVMRMIGEYQPQLGFSQLIGPNPVLVIPLGHYDADTLGEHKSHIHLGWHA